MQDITNICGNYSHPNVHLPIKALKIKKFDERTKYQLDKLLAV